MQPISHPKLQRLYDYWLTTRGARTMPSRTDIDPIDMTFIIGNVILIDVLAGEPPDFRIRLHGTNLVDRVRYDLTGKMLDDMPEAEFRDLTRRSFTKVATSRAPLCAQRDRVLDGRLRRYETVIMPLSADDKIVDTLICGLIYDDDR